MSVLQITQPSKELVSYAMTLPIVRFVVVKIIYAWIVLLVSVLKTEYAFLVISLIVLNAHHLTSAKLVIQDSPSALIIFAFLATSPTAHHVLTLTSVRNAKVEII